MVTYMDSPSFPLRIFTYRVEDLIVDSLIFGFSMRYCQVT